MTTLEEIGLDLFDIDYAIEAGYISVRTHPDSDDLRIYNYTAKTQYERVWHLETMTCRGLILDFAPNNIEVVARPFKKFFNLGELESIPEGPFVAQEKMDGSLGIIYMAPDGHPSVATRGSFSSEQAEWATRWLRFHVEHREVARDAIANGLTLLVEIIYPENRIVINYGSREELVLLAAIDVRTGKDVSLSEVGWPGKVAETYSDFTLELFQEQDGEGPSGGGFNREGVVLRWEDGTRAKVKFEEYVRLHRILTRVTERSIWEILSAGQPLSSLAEYVPDEFYKWMESVADTLRKEFSALETQALSVLSQVDRAAERKSQAEFILQNPNPGIVFKMLDSQPYRDIIWKMIRPAATTLEKDEG